MTITFIHDGDDESKRLLLEASGFNVDKHKRIWNSSGKLLLTRDGTAYTLKEFEGFEHGLNFMRNDFAEVVEMVIRDEPGL